MQAERLAEVPAAERWNEFGLPSDTEIVL